MAAPESISSDIDWVQDVCSVNLGTVAQIDNKIYALGGWLFLRDSSDPNVQGPWIANSHIRTIDLSSPPSGKGTTIDITKDLKSLITAKRLPPEIPRTIWGNSFSSDTNTLHYFGGLQNPQPIYNEDGKWDLDDRVDIADNMWKYAIDKDEWAGEGSDGKKLVSGLGKDVLGQGAKTQDFRKSDAPQMWLYGGGVWTQDYLIGNETVKNAGAYRELRDLVQSTPDPDSEEIILEKLSTKTSDSATARGAVQASMVFVDAFGEEGVLVLMGGKTFDILSELTEVHIYDIKTKVWYTQTTSAEGDTFPDHRTEGCVVAAPAPDGSSYNIYLYGGQKPNPDGKDPAFLGLGEVWILTLPSFQWVRSNKDFPITRVGHSCSRIHSRYMVSYGGVGSTLCDEYGGLQVYDMSVMEWTTKIETGKEGSEYWVPDKVVKAIGGSRDGKASVFVPKKGFADPKLKEIFYLPGAENNNTSPTTTSNINNTPIPTPTSDSNTGSASETPSTSSGLQGTPRTLAIAIPTIVLSLVLIAITFCIWSRRRRRREAEAAAARSYSIELGPALDPAGPWGSGNEGYYGELASQAKGGSDPNLTNGGTTAELDSNYPPAYELSGLQDGTKGYNDHDQGGLIQEHYAAPPQSTTPVPYHPNGSNPQIQHAPDHERGYNA